MSIARSINGIVCIVNHEFLTQYVGLWNPTIKKWRLMALPQNKKWKRMSAGLGFDFITEDFKIIIIVPEPELKDISRIKIFSVTNET